MIIVGSFLPEPLVGKRHQVYSGLQGAGVVMESITLIDLPNRHLSGSFPGHLLLQMTNA